MMNVDRIKTVFPQDWPAILDKCNTDPVLKEICDDFERLTSDLESANAEKTFMSESLKEDVLKSLEELVLEIREKI